MAPHQVVSPFETRITELVRYKCSCGCLKPISQLYFCRHCLDVRCGFCVSHEVDSHYCPNCMENMPSAEARLKKNRCGNCFDCPHCNHTLSTRATSITLPSPDDPSKMVAKKVYYLACAFCRWTSRDIGLPDQNVASGGWPDQENLSSERISALLEHYRSIAQREKIEKESRRFLGRKLSYLQLSDKYGLTTVVARKRAGLPPHASAGGKTEDLGRQVDIAPAEPVDLDDENDLPESLMTDPLDLFSVTSMCQRLVQLEQQPHLISDLFPKHKHLMIKRSQRCRQCEHNLSKPEYNPTSIKFKIQLAAYYHVPDIIIYKVGEIAADKTTKLEIKITNPSNTATVLEFMDLEKLEQLKSEERSEVKEEKKPVSAINPLRQPSIVKSVDQSLGLVNTRVKIPSSKVYLPPKDEAAEFDDHGVDLAGHQDDPGLVVWRKNNKVCLRLEVSQVTPSQTSGDQIVGLGIQYQYTNTVFALDTKEVHTATMRIPVFINIGSC